MVDINKVSNQIPDTRQRDNIRNTRVKEEIIRQRIEEGRRSESSRESVTIEREKGRRLDVSG